MDIRKIPISKINPAPYNPRKDLRPGDRQYEEIKASIEEFDYVEPLVWNERTGTLISGHQRLKILKEKGLEEIEVSVVDVDHVKERAMNIALNRLRGEWDLPALSESLEELINKDYDVEITGFNAEEIDKLLSEFAPLELDDIGHDEDDDSTLISCPKCGFRFEVPK